MLKNTEKAPSPRIAKKREQVEREILEIAQSISSEAGPKGVTLASVAGRLECTPKKARYFSRMCRPFVLVLSSLSDFCV